MKKVYQKKLFQSLIGNVQHLYGVIIIGCATIYMFQSLIGNVQQNGSIESEADFEEIVSIPYR